MNRKKILIFTGFLVLFFGATILIFSFSQKEPSNSIPPIFKPIPKEKQLPDSLSSQPFNLTHWKLTLPIESPSNPNEPLEIKQPELSTYQIDPWFKLTPDKKGIAFRAPVNAPTTANSDYPRSELREMTTDGKDEIFWSSTKGTHTLFLEEAITATPKNKQEVVAGQIHGDDGDLLVIRLEGNKLFLARNKANLYTLDENYTLGKRFIIKFLARDGELLTYYNNSPKPVHTLEKKVNQAYFKIGVYTQSNCETEESNNLCSTDNYGEVIVYQADITHE